MTRIKSAKFRDKTFRILWEWPPPNHDKNFSDRGEIHYKARRIYIRTDVHQKQVLKALIDEAIHACSWDLDNDAVWEYSEAIGNFLWRTGLRWPD
jgi:hypothetical protein